MHLPAILDFIGTLPTANVVRELLELNGELKKHDLFLNAADAESILIARSESLKALERIELDLKLTKDLIYRAGFSPYIRQENLVETVNDLYEIFHQIKNLTSDWVADDELLETLMVCFNTFCGGSTELLMGKGVEKIVDNFRRRHELGEMGKEEGDIFDAKES